MVFTQPTKICTCTATEISAFPCRGERVSAGVRVIREIRVEIGEVRLRPEYGGGGKEGEGEGQRGRGLVEAVHLGRGGRSRVQLGTLKFTDGGGGPPKFR